MSYRKHFFMEIVNVKIHRYLMEIKKKLEQLNVPNQSRKHKFLHKIH